MQLGSWNICLLVQWTKFGYPCTRVVVNLAISSAAQLLTLYDLDKRLVVS